MVLAFGAFRVALGGTINFWIPTWTVCSHLTLGSALAARNIIIIFILLCLNFGFLEQFHFVPCILPLSLPWYRWSSCWFWWRLLGRSSRCIAALLGLVDEFSGLEDLTGLVEGLSELVEGLSWHVEDLPGLVEDWLDLLVVSSAFERSLPSTSSSSSSSSSYLSPLNLNPSILSWSYTTQQ